MNRFAAALAGLIAFVALATANGAGYRYGVSDQAAYVPAIMLAENPAAFPRDAQLIHTQGQFFVLDEALATIGNTTGAPVEWLFVGAYLFSLLVIWIGVLLIGTRLYSSLWLTCAFALVVTLRHRITLTAANSLEPYFHPRLLAFGFGLIAIGSFLRRSTGPPHLIHRSAPPALRTDWLAIAAVGVAAICHITTALWFAILLGTALAIVDRRWRLPAALGSLVAVAVVIWLVVAGPLHAASKTMDAVWIEAVAGKDYLFANEWPWWGWPANLGLIVLLWIVQTVRERRGTATAEDRALAWGATALVALFLLTLPAVIAHVAIAVQFQITRVFWIVDVLAAMYLIAAIGEVLTQRGMAALTIALLSFSTARGIYILHHQHRDLMEVSLPHDAWLDAMNWIAKQPPDVYVLADPGHATMYGSSVRVASQRDVLLEDVKDSAIAIYSRPLAGQVVDRRRAIGTFSALTADKARALGQQYDLNYLVTTATLPLAEVYRNSRFRIYALQPVDRASESRAR